MAALFGSKWSCKLLCIVLKGALSEVMKVYPLSEAEGHCGRYYSLHGRRFRDLPGIAKKVLKSMKKADALG